jgi:hypothetical protein
MSVIEYEIDYLTKYAKKLRGDDREFILSKVESIQFEKTNIETNVSTGIFTPEKYVKGIKVFRKKIEALLDQATKQLGPKNEHTLRLKKKLSLLDEEITDF